MDDTVPAAVPGEEPDWKLEDALARFSALVRHSRVAEAPSPEPAPESRKAVPPSRALVPQRAAVQPKEPVVIPPPADYRRKPPGVRKTSLAALFEETPRSTADGFARALLPDSGPRQA